MYKLSVHCLADTAEQILKAISTCSVMLAIITISYIHVNDYSISLVHCPSPNMNDSLLELGNLQKYCCIENLTSIKWSQAFF